MVKPNAWAELEPALNYSGLKLRVSRNGAVEERGARVVDHFGTEMDHFSECIQTNAPPKTPGEEGLRDLKIMMAIYEAARGGRTVKLS